MFQQLSVRTVYWQSRSSANDDNTDYSVTPSIQICDQDRFKKLLNLGFVWNPPNEEARLSLSISGGPNP
jgi:hypothetical protein